MPVAGVTSCSQHGDMTLEPAQPFETRSDARTLGPTDCRATSIPTSSRELHMLTLKLIHPGVSVGRMALGDTQACVEQQRGCNMLVTTIYVGRSGCSRFGSASRPWSQRRLSRACKELNSTLSSRQPAPSSAIGCSRGSRRIEGGWLGLTCLFPAVDRLLLSLPVVPQAAAWFCAQVRPHQS